MSLPGGFRITSGYSHRVLGAVAALTALAALSGCAEYAGGYGEDGYGSGYYAPAYSYAPSYGYARGGRGWGGEDHHRGGWHGDRDHD